MSGIAMSRMLAMAIRDSTIAGILVKMWTCRSNRNLQAVFPLTIYCVPETFAIKLHSAKFCSFWQPIFRRVLLSVLYRPTFMNVGHHRTNIMARFGEDWGSAKRPQRKAEKKRRMKDETTTAKHDGCTGGHKNVLQSAVSEWCCFIDEMLQTTCFTAAVGNVNRCSFRCRRLNGAGQPTRHA